LNYLEADLKNPLFFFLGLLYNNSNNNFMINKIFAIIFFSFGIFIFADRA